MAVCWGIGNFSDATPEDERFVAIDTGFLSACGVREDGTTICWDYGYGPPFTLEHEFIAVSTGPFQTCGLLEGRRCRL